ncbi:indolepyruvate ferredoxin oxidoreductase subunit alpha, partial [Symbiobacterium thermophilum]
IKATALCGLGQTAPNPVLSTLRYFREEYEAHVRDKHCPAGRCKALTDFRIDQERCKACNVCARNCPVDAIHGEVRKPETFYIDAEACIKCGTCATVCKFNAVVW